MRLGLAGSSWWGGRYGRHSPMGSWRTRYGGRLGAWGGSRMPLSSGLQNRFGRIWGSGRYGGGRVGRYSAGAVGGGGMNRLYAMEQRLQYARDRAQMRAISEQERLRMHAEAERLRMEVERLRRQERMEDQRMRTQMRQDEMYRQREMHDDMRYMHEEVCRLLLSSFGLRTRLMRCPNSCRTVSGDRSTRSAGGSTSPPALPRHPRTDSISLLVAVDRHALPSRPAPSPPPSSQPKQSQSPGESRRRVLKT